MEVPITFLKDVKKYLFHPIITEIMFTCLEFFIQPEMVMVFALLGTLNSWSVEVCYIQATLTSENFGLENFTLYPNPNNGSFNIQFNSNTGNEIKINVHDVRGREIFAKSYNNNGLFNESLELNNVQSGVYLVTVQDGVRKEVKKIVVQ